MGFLGPLTATLTTEGLICVYCLEYQNSIISENRGTSGDMYNIIGYLYVSLASFNHWTSLDFMGASYGIMEPNLPFFLNPKWFNVIGIIPIFGLLRHHHSTIHHLTSFAYTELAENHIQNFMNRYSLPGDCANCSSSPLQFCIG